MAGYRAPADAAGVGIERGIGIVKGLAGLQRQGELDARADAEHDLRMQEGKQRIDASQAAQARQDDADLLRLSTDESKNIQAEHDAAIQRYGGWDKVPQDVASGIGKRYRGWQENHNQLMERARKRIGGWVDEGRQTARDLAGGKPMAQVEPKALVNAIAVNTGMDPEDFLDKPGQPSALRQAGEQIVRAGETGNWQEVVPAANVLLKAELRQGIGTLGRDGTPIVSKEIVGFVPVQDGSGDEVYPVLRVKTQGHPDGYTAPVTKDRTADPDDPPITVSVSKLVDRLQHVSTLVETLNHPQVAGRVMKGMSEVGDEVRSNLEAFSRMPGGKRKTTTHDTNLNDRVRQTTRYDDTGEVVAERDLEKGVDPALEPRLAAMERVAGIRADTSRANNADNNDTRRAVAAQTEAGRTARNAATNATRVAAGGARGDAAGGRVTKDQLDKMVDAEASKYGAYRKGGQWKQWKGSGEPGKGSGMWIDATPETLDKVTEIQGRLAKQTSPAAAGIGSHPQAPVEPGSRTVGTTYMTPKGPLKWMGNGWQAAQ